MLDLGDGGHGTPEALLCWSEPVPARVGRTI